MVLCWESQAGIDLVGQALDREEGSYWLATNVKVGSYAYFTRQPRYHAQFACVCLACECLAS